MPIIRYARTIDAHLKAVLTNKTVIFCTIIVFLYVKFVWFVGHYRKKPKPVKTKRVAAPAPAPAAENPPAEGGDGGEHPAE